MPKIILFTDAWYPQVNGVIRCVEEMQKRLQQRGFEVTLVHPGVFSKTVPLPMYPEIRIPLFAKRKIGAMVRDIKPDYIHIFTEGPVGMATRSVCVAHGLAFTTSYHTHFPYYFKKYLKVPFAFDLAYAYVRRFHAKAKATMVITERYYEELGKKGIKNLKLWRLGVDTDFFKRDINSPIQGHYPAPVFVYFGRVAQEKSVEEFLKLRLPGTKLVIGDGPARKTLEKTYGKEAIFTGYKKGQELVDLLSVCNVFVFPSKTDTFPLAIIEAMACGLPVAAHRVMGLEELVVSGTGVLADDLQKAAVECLSLSPEKCRQHALIFSWQSSADMFMQNLVPIR
jgi:glycosyltransferase involved in cell wall biosynthesis